MEKVSLKGCNRALAYGTDNKPLSKARVLDTGSSVYLFLENSNLRQAHVRVFVDFYGSRNGVIRCWCDLHIRRNQQIGNPQEVWAAECQVLELVTTIQRQKDLRIQTNMPIFFSHDSGVLKRGTIKNISAGGIFLVTKYVLKNGSKLSYDQTLNGQEFEVKAQVIYGRVLPEGYGYGCRFHHLSAQAEQVITSWCLAHQERKVVV